MSGRSFAFLGAGEFEDWHAEVDRTLLRGRDGRVLVCATAAAPEGDDVFDGWVGKGLAHYDRLGVSATAPSLKRPEDAHDEGVVGLLDDASMVFFSGGNPKWIAECLRASPFWDRLRGRLAEGTIAYAGCSAGVACLSDPTYDAAADDMERVWVPGLGYVPGVLFAPHWDVIDEWIPGARDFITASTPAAGVLVAIDERTAMIGDGTTWNVEGAGAVHVHPGGGGWTDQGVGSSFVLPFTFA
jgi:cyanophycinase-like exopeptidase